MKYINKAYILSNVKNISDVDMSQIKISVNGFKCERCKYEWIPRKKDYPRVCPNCKSPYWDKPRQNKK